MKGGRREGGRDCKEWIEKERHINKEGKEAEIVEKMLNEKRKKLKNKTYNIQVTVRHRQAYSQMSLLWQM